MGGSEGYDEGVGGVPDSGTGRTGPPSSGQPSAPHTTPSTIVHGGTSTSPSEWAKYQSVVHSGYTDKTGSLTPGQRERIATVTPSGYTQLQTPMGAWATESREKYYAGQRVSEIRPAVAQEQIGDRRVLYSEVEAGGRTYLVGESLDEYSRPLTPWRGDSYQPPSKEEYLQLRGEQMATGRRLQAEESLWGFNIGRAFIQEPDLSQSGGVYGGWREARSREDIIESAGRGAGFWAVEGPPQSEYYSEDERTVYVGSPFPEGTHSFGSPFEWVSSGDVVPLEAYRASWRVEEGPPSYTSPYWTPGERAELLTLPLWGAGGQRGERFTRAGEMYMRKYHEQGDIEAPNRQLDVAPASKRVPGGFWGRLSTMGVPSLELYGGIVPVSMDEAGGLVETRARTERRQAYFYGAVGALEMGSMALGGGTMGVRSWKSRAMQPRLEKYGIETGTTLKHEGGWRGLFFERETNIGQTRTQMIFKTEKLGGKEPTFFVEAHDKPGGDYVDPEGPLGRKYNVQEQNIWGENIGKTKTVLEANILVPGDKHVSSELGENSGLFTTGKRRLHTPGLNELLSSGERRTTEVPRTRQERDIRKSILRIPVKGEASLGDVTLPRAKYPEKLSVFTPTPMSKTFGKTEPVIDKKKEQAFLQRIERSMEASKREYGLKASVGEGKSIKQGRFEEVLGKREWTGRHEARHQELLLLQRESKGERKKTPTKDIPMGGGINLGVTEEYMATLRATKGKPMRGLIIGGGPQITGATGGMMDTAGFLATMLRRPNIMRKRTREEEAEYSSPFYQGAIVNEKTRINDAVGLGESTRDIINSRQKDLGSLWMGLRQGVGGVQMQTGRQDQKQPQMNLLAPAQTSLLRQDILTHMGEIVTPRAGLRERQMTRQKTRQGLFNILTWGDGGTRIQDDPIEPPPTPPPGIPIMDMGIREPKRKRGGRGNKPWREYQPSIIGGLLDIGQGIGQEIYTGLEHRRRRRR